MVARVVGERMAEAVEWLVEEAWAECWVVALLAAVRRVADTRATEALGSAALLVEDQEREQEEVATVAAMQEVLEAAEHTAPSHQRREDSDHLYTPRPPDTLPKT